MVKKRPSEDDFQEPGGRAAKRLAEFEFLREDRSGAHSVDEEHDDAEPTNGEHAGEHDEAIDDGSGDHADDC